MAAATNQVKNLRASRLWTQAQLAAKAKVNRKTISTVEGSSDWEPSILVQEKISRAFGLPRDIVFPADASSNGKKASR